MSLSFIESLFFLRLPASEAPSNRHSTVILAPKTMNDVEIQLKWKAWSDAFKKIF